MIDPVLRNYAAVYSKADQKERQKIIKDICLESERSGSVQEIWSYIQRQVKS